MAFIKNLVRWYEAQITIIEDKSSTSLPEQTTPLEKCGFLHTLSLLLVAIEKLPLAQDSPKLLAYLSELKATTRREDNNAKPPKANI